MASLTAEGWESRLEDEAMPDKKPRIESVDGGDKCVCEDGNDGKITRAEDPSDSDDDMPVHVRREFNRQIEESEGFDVEDFTNYPRLNMFVPLRIKDEFRPYAELAIKQFNEKENANFELVKLVNLAGMVITDINYYVTFEAKDADDGQIKTFQAVVVETGEHEQEVEFCRLKPPPTSKKQGSEHEQVGQRFACWSVIRGN